MHVLTRDVRKQSCCICISRCVQPAWPLDALPTIGVVTKGANSWRTTRGAKVYEPSKWDKRACVGMRPSNMFAWSVISWPDKPVPCWNVPSHRPPRPPVTIIPLRVLPQVRPPRRCAKPAHEELFRPSCWTVPIAWCKFRPMPSSCQHRRPK